MTPAEAFKQEYGQRVNFMTPNIIRYGWATDGVAFEISRGLGFDNKPIFGVTIIEVDANGKTRRRTDLCNMFFSIEEARSHIKEVADAIRT